MLPLDVTPVVALFFAVLDFILVFCGATDKLRTNDIMHLCIGISACVCAVYLVHLDIESGNVNFCDYFSCL